MGELGLGIRHITCAVVVPRISSRAFYPCTKGRELISALLVTI